jgi:hypothetical protein
LTSNGNNNVEAWSAIQERLRNAVAKEPGIPFSTIQELLELGKMNHLLGLPVKRRRRLKETF